MEAWVSKCSLKVEATGIAYMLRGDRGASNTDPYAMSPAAGNQWVATPAHLMLLFPDPKMLDSLPNGPEERWAWVMWKGHALCSRHGAAVDRQSGDDIVQVAAAQRRVVEYHKSRKWISFQFNNIAIHCSSTCSVRVLE